MVAQTIAARHSDAVRAVISLASSYGGRDAPQPAGGIDAMLGCAPARTSACTCLPIRPTACVRTARPIC